MTNTISPLHLLVVGLAGWLNREQQRVLEYLKEENRVLRQQLGKKRLRLTDKLAQCHVRSSRGHDVAPLFLAVLFP